jgi:hypothetical protein
MSTRYSSSSSDSGWAVGFVLFAAIMMIMLGSFQAIEGLIGIFNSRFYVATPDYVYQFNATAWGWVDLLVGALVALAGVAVLAGQLWGRIVGIALAVLSGIANFMFIPYYPFWSLLIITLDVFVVWALAAHGKDAMLTR